MRLFFLTIPKPLKQYTLFQKRISIPLSWAETGICVVAFTGCASPWNDTVGVAPAYNPKYAFFTISFERRFSADSASVISPFSIT